MTLIKSISGIRGTIGGTVDTNLTPIDAVKFAAAYGTWIKEQRTKKQRTPERTKQRTLSEPWGPGRVSREKPARERTASPSEKTRLNVATAVARRRQRSGQSSPSAGASCGASAVASERLRLTAWCA